MHFQFLIEDQSSAALIEILMQRISLVNKNITFCNKNKNTSFYYKIKYQIFYMVKDLRAFLGV